MTDMTFPAPVVRRTARPPAPGLSFAGVLRSEWVKLVSLRSTGWTLALTVVAAVGFSVLIAWGISTAGQAGGEAGPPTASASLLTMSYVFAQLPVVVLGVLSITGEYSTGTVRSTLSAVPRRLPVLWAKSVVLTVAVAATTLVALVLTWIATRPFLTDLGTVVDLGDPQTRRILLGMVLYLSTMALLAVAIGAILRHSAGAIATVLGLLLVVEMVFALLPQRFFTLVSPFLPSTAGSLLLADDEAIAMTHAFSDGADLSAWQGYGVLVAWVVVLMAVAGVLLRRRDA